MNDLDALLAPPESLATPCKLGRIIDKLNDPYKTALIGLLEVPFADGGESDTAIRERLYKAGFPVSQAVIYRHRNKQCSCEGLVMA